MFDIVHVRAFTCKHNLVVKITQSLMEGGCDHRDMEVQTTSRFPKTCFTPVKNNGRVLLGPRIVGWERGDSFVVIHVLPVVGVGIFVVVVIFSTWIVVVVVGDTLISNR